MRIFHRGWTHLLMLLLATLPFMAAAEEGPSFVSRFAPGLRAIFSANLK